MPSKVYRSSAVILGGAALLAAGLSGCSAIAQDGSEYESEYAQTCMETTTQLRADDYNCDTNRSGYGWYYLPFRASNGGVVPGVGSRLSGGSTSLGDVGGGSVSRGGFGARSGGSFGG